jgi:prepilin-type processing-associated H-X9-DG protein
LLPYLECQDRFDRLQSVPSGEVSKIAIQAIESYLCPDAKNSGEGGLSYVANAGMIASDDWSQTDSLAHGIDRYDFAFNGYGEGNLNAEDQLLAVASGVFWRASATNAGSIQPPRTLDEISRADGSSQTIHLSENLNTRSFDPATHTGGWISDTAGDIAFGITLAGDEIGGQFRVADRETPGGVGVAGGTIETGLQLSDLPVSADCRINANLANAKDGASPRPSSGHPGAVNMAYADGSCKVIFEGIDPTVYARLLTPMGSQYGQLPVSSADF